MPGGYWQELVVVTTLNPKLAMFLLAFLPQFIEPSRGPAWLQIAALGSVLTLAGAGFLGRGPRGRNKGNPPQMGMRRHDECHNPDLAG